MKVILQREWTPFILGGGLTLMVAGSALLFGHPVKVQTWCDNVQRANGCPGPARLEPLPHGALECHCDVWEKE